MTSATPRSVSVFSGRYHIMSNASIVNNCIILHGSQKLIYTSMFPCLVIAPISTLQCFHSVVVWRKKQQTCNIHWKIIIWKAQGVPQ